MNHHPRRRFWLEIALAVAGLTAGVLTLVWSDWIEAVFGVDPDHGNGSMEWALVAVLLGVVAASATLARSEWRRRTFADGPVLTR